MGGAINWSQPSAGERDVPLDFAPLITGYYDPDSLVLERGDGEPVPFELRLAREAHFCGRLAELLPSQPLEPDTDYRLRGSQGDEETVVEFTTGQRTVETVDLDPPVASGVLLPLDPKAGVSSCERDTRGCVAFEGNRHLEIIASVAGQEVEWVLTQFQSRSLDDGFVTLTTKPRVIPDCIEVRVRDEAGRRSPPTVLCGSALASSDESHDVAECAWLGELSGDPLSATAGTPSVGCSTISGQAASGRLGAPAVLLALLLLVLRRRKCQVG